MKRFSLAKSFKKTLDRKEMSEIKGGAQCVCACSSGAGGIGSYGYGMEWLVVM